MEQGSIDGGFRQNKAYRQRVTYWLGKGCTEEEAERRANIRNKLRLAPEWKPPIPKAGAKQNRLVSAKTKTCLDENPSTQSRVSLRPFNAATTYPSNLAIWTGTQRAESPTPNSSGETKTCQDGNLPTAPKTGLCPSTAEIRLPETHSLTADAVYLVICSVVVLGASALLIRSSAAVFGSSWDGWLKAALFELGIVGLSVYRPSTVLELLVSRGGAMVLATLALYVLHAGVKDATAHEITTAESSNTEVIELREERAHLVSVLSALPEEHLTRRQSLLQQLRDNSSRLQAAREKASRSASTQTIQRHYDVEAFARLALMFLNVCFAHGLAARFKSHRRSPLGSLDHRSRREVLGA